MEQSRAFLCRCRRGDEEDSHRQCAPQAEAQAGGDRKRVEFDEACSLADERADQLLALHEALEKLEAESPAKAELVKLRYFAGLSHQEAALALGISRATADRYWAYARVFLYSAMEDAEKN